MGTWRAREVWWFGGAWGVAMTGTYVVDLREVDGTRTAVVGGKGARLAELSRIEGVHVPSGFCVTTDAYREIVVRVPSIDDFLDRLSRLDPDDRGTIRALSAEIRGAVENIAIPEDLAAAITGAVGRLGEGGVAVRSSATAEDLPTASFAGQQDTYLNVVGAAAVLRHVSRCWASLFTERAVTYRRRAGVDDRTVRMAVVVQRMVFPDAAGILFTADPVTGNRKVAAIEAGFGLGELMVSGRVGADTFQVRGGAVVGRAIALKDRTLEGVPDGGTEERTIAAGRQRTPALTDVQAVRLAQLGRRIEAHFGGPQDIEWCLVGDQFQMVQSRPITTLFPVPQVGDRATNRVFLSVGHQQMMTDAMKPLGFSLWQSTAMAPMHEAGGRLFVDVTRHVATRAGRAGLLEMAGRTDPLTRDALETILAREDFLPREPEPSPDDEEGPGKRSAPAQIETDPSLVEDLIARSETSIAALRRDIRDVSGPELFDFLLAAFGEHRRVLGDPLSMQAIMAGIEATWWLNDTLWELLGEKNAADTLTLSAPGNVTSEMGLALLDVADVIRPHPELVAFLRTADEGFLEALPKLPGGAEARDAIEAYLERYGMRCTGEIDITRPRWSERPTTLLPLILDNVRNFSPGAARERFERGRRAAEAKAAEVLAQVRALPDGERRAAEVKRMIDRVRTFIGYREYPKYGIICRSFVYKQALMREAERLVSAGVIAESTDVFYLTFAEFHQAVRANRVDPELIGRRKEAFRVHQSLPAPRVLTSDGEAIDGSYHRDDVPGDALVGLGVSAGTVEGRARVVLDLSEADLNPGDILVTAYTDPSWTPLFVAVNALVTEVGGPMTHGAVIAREYGLPAVVGVPEATRRIADGQRIRVHGQRGYVEILR
ncbi:putative phosphoenolpyruvate synthase [Mangrovihabitans endophyticus]|uniref:Rifampicin phosphotransferase n=2 Tax=Mangrovihabitans endophyticus TaxID=1751298 RepID=A0A8J3FRY0_9ACTN|nr:putative phosphoenolpyruvate synthase [Mangrovihabitans endophyticus]